MKRIKVNQSGAVSMLSVAIFAIIITLVTTAYIRSVVIQQKNALNYDNNNRAYYAAEAGVQDAVRALNSGSLSADTDKTDCAPSAPNASGVVGASSDYGLSYTCQLVTFNTGDTKGYADPNASTYMMKLEPKGTPASSGYKVVLRWSKTVPVGSTETVYYPRATQNQMLLPPLTDWKNVDDLYHAMLRTSIISHPKSAGAISRDAVKQKVVFLNPTTNGGVDSTVDLNGMDYSVSETEQAKLTSNAECYPSNAVPGAKNFEEYSCKTTITLTNYNLATQDLYIRVGAVYRPTDFSVQLMNNNASVPIKSGDVAIDVTGKAGQNVFKRIKQTVSMGSEYVDTNPDAALIAGEGICKLFSIGTNPASYREGCNPLAN